MVASASQAKKTHLFRSHQVGWRCLTTWLPSGDLLSWLSSSPVPHHHPPPRTRNTAGTWSLSGPDNGGARMTAFFAIHMDSPPPQPPPEKTGTKASFCRKGWLRGSSSLGDVSAWLGLSENTPSLRLAWYEIIGNTHGVHIQQRRRIS